MACFIESLQYFGRAGRLGTILSLVLIFWFESQVLLQSSNLDDDGKGFCVIDTCLRDYILSQYNPISRTKCIPPSHKCCSRCMFNRQNVLMSENLNNDALNIRSEEQLISNELYLYFNIPENFQRPKIPKIIIKKCISIKTPIISEVVKKEEFQALRFVLNRELCRISQSSDILKLLPCSYILSRNCFNQMWYKREKCLNKQVLSNILNKFDASLNYRYPHIESFHRVITDFYNANGNDRISDYKLHLSSSVSDNSVNSQISRSDTFIAANKVGVRSAIQNFITTNSKKRKSNRLINDADEVNNQIIAKKMKIWSHDDCEDQRKKWLLTIPENVRCSSQFKFLRLSTKEEKKKQLELFQYEGTAFTRL